MAQFPFLLDRKPSRGAKDAIEAFLMSGFGMNGFGLTAIWLLSSRNSMSVLWLVFGERVAVTKQSYYEKMETHFEQPGALRPNSHEYFIPNDYSVFNDKTNDAIAIGM